MNIQKNLYEIVNEIKQFSEKTDEKQLEIYLNEIVKADRIYAAGVGRSGLAIRGFAMRLMHIGKEVHVLGDMTVPHTRDGDLLIIGSGSGETKSLIVAAEKAKDSGMRIALTTINKSSTIAKLSDILLVLPGASPKAYNNEMISIQPMGSAYEQLNWLVYDAIIMSLMEKLNRTSDEMFARHANIE